MDWEREFITMRNFRDREQERSKLYADALVTITKTKSVWKIRKIARDVLRLRPNIQLTEEVLAAPQVPQEEREVNGT